MKPQTFILPYPPTVNTYWRHVNGRTIVSKRGRQYRRLVELACAEAHVQPYDKTTRLTVTLRAHAPDNRRRDIDNILKALLDAMERIWIYGDDSQIDELTITRGTIDAGGPGYVQVTIGSIG